MTLEMLKRSTKWIFMGCMAFSLPISGHAATFNVTNATELQTALTTAQDNNEGDTIILAAGNYATGGTTFTYFPDLTLGSEENFPLTIQGSGATTTFLDGGNSVQVLTIDTSALPDDSNSDIVITDLTIENGSHDGFGGGAAIFTVDADITLNNSQILNNGTTSSMGGVDLAASGSGNINAANNLFIGNTAADDAGGAEFIVDGGSVIAVNNIFFDNQAGQIAGGLLLQVFSGDVVGGSLNLINNTIVQNDASTDGGGLFVFIDQGETLNSYNNIIFGNVAVGLGNDIFIDNGVLVANLLNSDFSDVCFNSTLACDPAAIAGVITGNNINTDPLLIDPAGGNFNLGLGSPAIDTGDAAAPNIPSTDYAGNPRIIGPAPDMGALEALPDIDVSPTSLNFGNVVVNGSSTLILTITNNGAGVLEVDSLDLGDGVNYSLDPTQGGDPCGSLTPSIAGGDSCTIGVVFGPTVGGASSSTLTVNSNDPDEAQVIVPLTGAVGNVEISGNGACGLQTGSAGALNWMIAMFGVVPAIYLRRRK